ncbi:MAG: transposase [bacterium]|nr:transposase [bacterium]
MRFETIQVGEYAHIYNRGNRKQDIIKNEKDSWRFIQALMFFNDSHSSVNILRQIVSSKAKKTVEPELQQMPESVFRMGWPKDWPEKDPLVKILCYCLSPNHFHLLLQEIREGGISKFMQKFGGGYTKYFNIKHKEVGRVFQGPYKIKIVGSDQVYLEYLSAYIQVKNVLELFPGGIQEAKKNISEAIKFLEKYVFSSCPDFLGVRNSLIIDKGILGEIFPTIDDYKKFIVSLIESGSFDHEVIADSLFDE